MGGYPSHSSIETASDYCQHFADGARQLARQGWVATNDVCSNSICSAIWPTRWAQQAEDADITYLPVGGRRDRDNASGESYVYASSPAAASSSASYPPRPYLSQPSDRALYAIEDEDDIPIDSPPGAVAHYSYRPAELMGPPSPQMPSGEERKRQASSPKRSRPRHTSSLSSAEHSSVTTTTAAGASSLAVPASTLSGYAPIGTPSPEVPTHPLSTQSRSSAGPTAAPSSSFQSPPPVHITRGSTTTTISKGQLVDRVDARDLVRDEEDDSDLVLIESPPPEKKATATTAASKPSGGASSNTSDASKKSVADFDPLSQHQPVASSKAPSSSTRSSHSKSRR